MSNLFICWFIQIKTFAIQILNTLNSPSIEYYTLLALCIYAMIIFLFNDRKILGCMSIVILFFIWFEKNIILGTINKSIIKVMPCINKTCHDNIFTNHLYFSIASFVVFFIIIDMCILLPIYCNEFKNKIIIKLTETPPLDNKVKIPKGILSLFLTKIIKNFIIHGLNMLIILLLAIPYIITEIGRIMLKVSRIIIRALIEGGKSLNGWSKTQMKNHIQTPLYCIKIYFKKK
jgi:hypothetical protein